VLTSLTMPLANNTSPTPNTRKIDFAALVRDAEGPEYNQPQDAYEFSNGRKFKESGASHGIYNPLGV
jgi:hypothetical protein